MKKLQCEVVISPNASEHLSQIVTGFMMLKKQGLINLKVSLSADRLTSMVEVIVNKSIVLVYDMADGFYFENEKVKALFEKADFIFKRSFNKYDNICRPFEHKIFPLGLNYHVTCKGNIMDKPTSKSATEKAKWYIKEFIGKNHHQQFYVKAFEDVYRFENNNPKILFSARTWGKDEGADLEFEETMSINEMRANCIRQLRKQFGDNFIGGFSRRREAVDLYSDCLLDDSITKRENFVQLVKDSDICISTIGLHKSNGWKLAEYVAASKAIVSESLHYDVPSFSPDINYLQFMTPDECVSKVSILVENQELLHQMKKENYDFYHKFLRPDKIVLNTLIKCY